jgi:O-acetyl-ADP-ribose deacetylase (regulator of RNase III)
MTTSPEFAVVMAFDVLQDVIASGADPRGPLGSGAAWTIDTYGTPRQRAQLQRLKMAAASKHGAVPSRTTAKNGKAGAADTFGMDALDRAIAKSFDTEEDS